MQVHAAVWLVTRPTFRYALRVPGEDLFLATTRPCSVHPMGTLEWSRRDTCSENSTPTLHSLIRMASYAYHLRLACLSQEGLGFNRSIASPWAHPTYGRCRHPSRAERADRQKVGGPTVKAQEAYESLLSLQTVSSRSASLIAAIISKVNVNNRRFQSPRAARQDLKV